MAGQVHPTASSPLPPPATYSKPHHRHRRSGHGGCCCLFSTLCTLLLAFVFLAGVTILILWLVLEPIHLPEYNLNNVEIKAFGVGQGSTLNADFVYNSIAENPNRKIGIKYDAMKLDTSYDGQVFGQSSIPAFYQGHQNTTTVASELNVKDFALKPTSATALTRHSQSNSVPLHVRADAKVHVRIGKYNSPGFWVRVDCDVVMGVAPAELISKSCKLKRRT